KARVKIIRYNLDSEHRDRPGPQMCIQRITHRPWLKLFRKIDMCDLAERVHTGVGAAGTLHRPGLAGKILDRSFQDTLHRGSVGLELPSLERRAVIFYGKLIARHA